MSEVMPCGDREELEPPVPGLGPTCHMVAWGPGHSMALAGGAGLPQISHWTVALGSSTLGIWDAALAHSISSPSATPLSTPGHGHLCSSHAASPVPLPKPPCPVWLQGWGALWDLVARVSVGWGPSCPVT